MSNVVICSKSIENSLPCLLSWTPITFQSLAPSFWVVLSYFLKGLAQCWWGVCVLFLGMRWMVRLRAPFFHVPEWTLVNHLMRAGGTCPFSVCFLSHLTVSTHTTFSDTCFVFSNHSNIECQGLYVFLSSSLSSTSFVYLRVSNPLHDHRLHNTHSRMGSQSTHSGWLLCLFALQTTFRMVDQIRNGPFPNVPNICMNFLLMRNDSLQTVRCLISASCFLTFAYFAQINVMALTTIALIGLFTVMLISMNYWTDLLNTPPNCLWLMVHFLSPYLEIDSKMMCLKILASGSPQDIVYVFVCICLSVFKQVHAKVWRCSN